MILVTDGEERSALAVVRSLGRAGYEVGVCSARKDPLAGASRHCRVTFRTPDPGADPAAFADAVESLAESQGAELVIPMTDVTAPLLLALRERRPEIPMPFPSLAKYREMSDKARLTEIAARLGVPVPRQIVISDPRQNTRESVRAVAEAELGWPLILKPARSAALVGGGVRKLSVSTVSGPDALAAGLTACPAEAYPLLLQRRIVGPGLGVFVLGDSRGQPLASFAHRRIREKPPTGGVSVYRESVPVRDDLRRYSELITTHLGWHGALMLEFKEDASTGTPYLMEANARFWGSLQLAIDSGVDFPRLLVESALGGEVEPVHEYRTGVRSRWLWGDFDHLLWVLRAPASTRRQYPSLPGRMGALARFLLPWWPGDRYEVLRWSDPRPFLRESVQWIESLGSGRRDRHSSKCRA